MEPQVTQLASREVWLAWWSSFPTGIIQMSARKKGCVCVVGGCCPLQAVSFFEELVLNLKECLQGSGGSPWAKRRWVFLDRSALGRRRRADESEDLWRGSDVAA